MAGLWWNGYGPARRPPHKLHLEKHLKKQTDAITSIALYPLFRDKSVNTPSFLLSVPKHKGIVITMKGKQRQHELSDPKPFREQMKGLIDAGTDLDPESKPRKTPIRKKTSIEYSRFFAKNGVLIPARFPWQPTNTYNSWIYGLLSDSGYRHDFVVTINSEKKPDRSRSLINKSGLSLVSGVR